VTIFLVRHGETAFNRDGLGLGREDVPLTELGLRQADALAARFERIGIQRVVSSPLQRAAFIAEGIAARHGLVVESREELTELDVGATEGLPFAEMRRQFPEFLAEWAGPNGWQARMPDGESIEDVADRVEPLVTELLNFEGRAVVVSHNFVVRVMFCRLLGLSAAQFRSLNVDLASVTSLVAAGPRVSVAMVNDRCHLPA